MKNELVVLPQEVEQLAKNVSAEKRNEVQRVLNSVFNGVSKMRKQLDSVDVEDENDKVNMRLANTIRLGVRSVRLDAEKVFDAKRSEVQQAMMSFKTEDALWLKAKQTMQILTKEIEANAKWKEQTKERIEAERKELKTQKREQAISKFNPEISRVEFENMSDETFNVMLAGIEKEYNDKIAAEKKAEADRIAKEKAEAAERERIRKENERLWKEAEAKEKQLAAERAKAAQERKTAADKARKEREAIEEKAEQKLKAQREAARKVEAERSKLRAALKAKEFQELQERKAAADKAREDEEEKKLAEKKANAAPDKIKLLSLSKSIQEITFPELKSVEAKQILSDVKSLLSKISGFIETKTQKL